MQADSASVSRTAEARVLTVDDLARLAESFEDAEQPFLGYAFRLAHYELSADSTARLASGLAALNGALFAQRYDEAEHALRRLADDYPALIRTFRFQYAYLLLQDGRHAEARPVLDGLGEAPEAGPRLPLLRATAALHEDAPLDALAQLRLVNTDEAFGPQGAPYAVAAARLALEEGAPRGRKSPVLALGMSAVLPGAGQLYTGHTYDALQAFVFTGALSYGAFASWRYELDRESPNLVLPVLSSAIAAVFYLSNVRGAHASAARANRFAEARFYRSVLERLEFVLADDGWFLGVRLEP